MAPSSSTPRLIVVDALRGFAILSIMLLHNIEHFDLYHFPDDLPEWLKAIDSIIWDTLFFLFGGKSYAIFALLFGLTFYIQYNNQQQRGNDFSGRFLWRLLLLLCFGFLNSIFFEGDILAIYAIIGVVLVPFRRLSNRLVWSAAIVLMMQPLEWIRLFGYLINPDNVEIASRADGYFSLIGEPLSNGTFLEAMRSNLTNGRLAVFFWSYENGRFFQTAALFLTGFMLGRTQRFTTASHNKTFWQRALTTAIVAFIPLFLLHKALPHMEWHPYVIARIQTAVTSWSNLAFMTMLGSTFVLLFGHTAARSWLNKLSPMGRMSLSNYVLQSILGSFVYYGFGLGLYQYTGASFSLIIGLGLGILQILFSTWWLKQHKRGPLEQIWHRLTWI
ncbi:DUF418 domain-containing protein [Thermophagus sp. OGC60D27]|uniref:DUF418 domain-containing protein n=1 Tax=Thermophagus sp. OGC60D27 TaxID=3458415 RepID=UPI0040382C77